jgi:hypothetical protein
MAIPPDFNDVESLTDIVRREHNRQVKEWFANTPDNDVSTPESRLKRACIIKDDDPLLVALQRQWLFSITIGKSRSLQTPVYGIPVTAFAIQRQHKPQVCLYFQQNSLQVSKGDNPVTGEISYRLMNESTDSMTQSKLEVIANKIKNVFGRTTTPYVWKKGRTMCTYTSWEEGLSLKILADGEQEGERVVKDVLRVHGGTFDSTKLNVNRNKDPLNKYPQNRKTKNILGKAVKLPINRPVADVRFRYATLALHGLARPVHLFDLTLTLTNPVIQSNVKIF